VRQPGIAISRDHAMQILRVRNGIFVQIKIKLPEKKETKRKRALAL